MVASVAAAGLGAGLAAQPAAATAVSGGTILTVDRRFSEVEAVAIRGNRILAAGTAAEVSDAAGPDAIGGIRVLETWMDGRRVHAA